MTQVRSGSYGPCTNDDAFYIICKQARNQYARCRRNELAPHTTNRAANDWKASYLNYWHLFAACNAMRRVMELHIKNRAPRISDARVCFGTPAVVQRGACGRRRVEV